MRVKLVKIIKKLQSKSEKKREEALMELANLELDEIQLEHLEYVIASTATVYQNNENHEEDASGALMEFVSRYDVTELVPNLVEQFPKMSIWARSILLTLLTRVKTEESFEALLKLLEQYIDQLPFADFEIELMGDEQECVDILFPKLFKYIELPSIRYTINRYVWLCLNKGTLQAEDVEEETATFIKEYQEIKQSLETYQSRLTPQTKWTQSYQELRHLAGLFLDIFGFLNEKLVVKELQQALQLKDNRLRYFAVSSLLRLQRSVDQELINELAADNETRNFLYYTLKQLEQEHLYPMQYFNQQAFAEAELVSWLVYPTEMGHIPTEIECMDVITREEEHIGMVNYYLFRFKSDQEHWEDAGWIAGVAGFYIQDEEPTLIAHGYTFSLFESWEIKTPEEHLDSMFDVLVQYWENQVD